MTEDEVKALSIWMSLKCVFDVYGGLYDKDGLDIDYLLDRRASFGTVTKLFENTLTNKELLEQECDILVPAAIENQITLDNTDRIQAAIVVEAANGPTTLDATRIVAYCLYRMFWQVPEASSYPILNGCKTTKGITGQKRKCIPDCKK